MKIVFYILFGLGLLSPTILCAQITVATDQFASGDLTTISTNADVSIESNLSNLGSASLVLVGENQNITTANEFVIKRLTILGGGLKRFTNRTTVEILLDLSEGHILAEDAFGFAGDPGLIENASELSFVLDKFFYDRTATDVSSTLTFPIGSNANGVGYAPLVVEGVSSGSLVVGSVSNGSFASEVSPINLPLEVGSASSNWYWQIEDENNNFSGGQIVLPFREEDKAEFNTFDRPVVLQVDASGLAVNLDNDFLSGSIADDNVQSRNPGSTGYFMVGRVISETPLVHNIISPNGDNVNDYLFVQNVDRYPENEITLVDRWGVAVYQKKNYVNPVPEVGLPGDDFTFLPPGNYICIFKYNGGENTIKQTVTVAK